MEMELQAYLVQFSLVRWEIKEEKMGNKKKKTFMQIVAVVDDCKSKSNVSAHQSCTIEDFFF